MLSSLRSLPSPYRLETATLATTKQSVIQAPSPLTRKIKYAVLNLIKPNLAFLRCRSRWVKFTNLPSSKMTDLSKNQPNLINIAKSKQKSG